MGSFSARGAWRRNSSDAYSLDAYSGAIRFLAYLNQARLGSYQAALSVPGADISKTRKYRYKYGFGLNWEQEVARDAGVFSRLGWSDGHNEAWMFTDINYSGSAGVSVRGEAWNRPDNTIGVAGVLSGIFRASTRNFFGRAALTTFSTATVV